MRHTSRFSSPRLLLLSTIVLAAGCGARPLTLVPDRGAAVVADGAPAATKDVIASQSCSSNQDCAPGDFCQLKGIGCQQPGVCQPRPTDCSRGAPCAGICGCDQVWYCDRCHANLAGVSQGACAGAPMSCADINTQYVAAVKQAKACDGTNSEAYNYCSKPVWNALDGCPCQVYVNDSSPALQTLTSLEKLWTRSKCGPLPSRDMVCDAIYPMCPAAVGASCLGGPGPDGTCTDQY